MLHTKFRQSAGSREEDFFMVFTIYGHGGHLGHVMRLLNLVGNGTLEVNHH